MTEADDQDDESVDIAWIGRQMNGSIRMEDTMADYMRRTPRYFDGEDERLGGYGGTWTFFKGASADPEQQENQFRAYRCFSIAENKSLCLARFFHETRPAGTKSVQRSQDGLYESVSRRPFADPFFGRLIKLTDVEAAEGRHPCFFWRIIPWTENFLIRMSLELPPDSTQLMEGFSSNPLPGAVDPLTIVNSTWALEAFLDDGQTRWSVGPIYSIHTRRLMSNFTIREHVTVVQPAERIDFDCLPNHPLRPRLGPDAQEWISESWQGVMQECIFDEDGTMTRVKARPTNWVPPDENYLDYSLVRYLDSVYGYFPTRLPSLIDPGDCSLSNSIRFEVGGFMREVREFRRLILRYSGDGKPSSLTMEWYSPRTRSQCTLSVLRASSAAVL